MHVNEVQAAGARRRSPLVGEAEVGIRIAASGMMFTSDVEYDCNKNTSKIVNMSVIDVMFSAKVEFFLIGDSYLRRRDMA